MSHSVRPHRQQPTRLPRPWDSPGKNAGVGCHFLLQCMKVKRESEVAQSCPTLSNPMDPMQPSRLLRPWDFPGKSTAVGCHCLLQFKCRSCINADWKEWPHSSHTVSACAAGSALHKCKLVLDATMQDCICIPASGKPLSASHPLACTM